MARPPPLTPTMDGHINVDYVDDLGGMPAVQQREYRDIFKYASSAKEREALRSMILKSLNGEPFTIRDHPDKVLINWSRLITSLKYELNIAYPKIVTVVFGLSIFEDVLVAAVPAVAGANGHPAIPEHLENRQKVIYGAAANVAFNVLNSVLAQDTKEYIADLCNPDTPGFICCMAREAFARLDAFVHSRSTGTVSSLRKSLQKIKFNGEPATPMQECRLIWSVLDKHGGYSETQRVSDILDRLGPNYEKFRHAFLMHKWSSAEELFLALVEFYSVSKAHFTESTPTRSRALAALEYFTQSEVSDVDIDDPDVVQNILASSTVPFTSIPRGTGGRTGPGRFGRGFGRGNGTGRTPPNRRVGGGDRRDTVPPGLLQENWRELADAAPDGTCRFCLGAHDILRCFRFRAARNAARRGMINPPNTSLITDSEPAAPPDETAGAGEEEEEEQFEEEVLEIRDVHPGRATVTLMGDLSFDAPGQVLPTSEGNPAEFLGAVGFLGVTVAPPLDIFTPVGAPFPDIAEWEANRDRENFSLSRDHGTIVSYLGGTIDAQQAEQVNPPPRANRNVRRRVNLGVAEPMNDVLARIPLRNRLAIRRGGQRNPVV